MGKVTIDQNRLFSEEEQMPVYEYECQNCKKGFIEVLTLKEHETGKVACPSCGSKEVKQLISPFIAHTASKTGSIP